MPSSLNVPHSFDMYADGLKLNKQGFFRFGSFVNKKIAVGSGFHALTDGYRLFFDGKISEIIIYNKKLSDSDRNSIESYLGNKYSINISSD